MLLYKVDMNIVIKSPAKHILDADFVLRGFTLLDLGIYFAHLKSLLTGLSFRELPFLV